MHFVINYAANIKQTVFLFKGSVYFFISISNIFELSYSGLKIQLPHFPKSCCGRWLIRALFKRIFHVAIVGKKATVNFALFWDVTKNRSDIFQNTRHIF